MRYGDFSDNVWTTEWPLIQWPMWSSWDPIWLPKPEANLRESVLIYIFGSKSWRYKIPKPITRFYGSPMSKKAYPMLADLHRHRKQHGEHRHIVSQKFIYKLAYFTLCRNYSVHCFPWPVFSRNYMLFNCVTIYCVTCVITVSASERLPPCFRWRCRSTNIGYASVDMGDPENLDAWFGIWSLPMLEVEIRVIPI